MIFTDQTTQIATQNHGALESPKDYRDGIAAAAMPMSPVPANVTSYVFDMDPFPVLMQALEPACVNHWLATAMQKYWYDKTGKIIPFSARFGDVLCKKYDGQAIDGGTFPRLALQLACKYGMATTATVPNDTTLPLAQYRDPSILTPAAYADAAQYKIPGYIAVQLTQQAMQAAIYNFGIVGTCRNIGSEWWTDVSGNTTWADSALDPLRTPAVVVGGHMTEDFAFNPTQNKLRNQWSKAWANQGNASYNFAAWLPFIREAWVIAEIPANVQGFLSQLPKASDFHYTWSADLHYGDVSDDVKFAQIALMILGYMNVIDSSQLGTYGPKTRAAVFAYQVANKIASPAPNSIGPQTRTLLNAQFAV